MQEKYDLAQMIHEIEEDDNFESGTKSELSQDDIMKMLREKQKQKKG